MRKNKIKIVDTQHLDEKVGSDAAYWNYINSSSHVRDSDDQLLECELANPDSLMDQSYKPSTPQLLMGEAVEHLQGRQKTVYLMHMREDMSFAEIGEALGLSKDTVRTYNDRAIAFITAYCKQAIDGGRV